LGFFFASLPVERWTIDGERLETLTFVVGIEPGEPLLRVVDEKDANQPRFERWMSPSEIMDLFTAALGKALKTPLPDGRDLRAVRFAFAAAERRSLCRVLDRGRRLPPMAGWPLLAGTRDRGGKSAHS
jgi:hypothetical protein